MIISMSKRDPVNYRGCKVVLEDVINDYGWCYRIFVYDTEGEIYYADLIKRRTPETIRNLRRSIEIGVEKVKEKLKEEQ